MTYTEALHVLLELAARVDAREDLLTIRSRHCYVSAMLDSWVARLIGFDHDFEAETESYEELVETILFELEREKSAWAKRERSHRNG